MARGDTVTPSSTGGSDRFTGGDGIDTVDYRYFTAALSITTDGTANDGVVGGTGQYDNIIDDVENIIAGSGNDTINTSARSTGGTVTGGNGADTITGGSGADVLIGGDGNDRLESRDSLTGETVNCGNGRTPHSSTPATPSRAARRCSRSAFALVRMTS